MSQHDQFTTGQVESAIKDFLKFGEDQNGIGHKGYFSGSGWAANCLRSHLAALSATQPDQAAQYDGEDTPEHKAYRRGFGHGHDMGRVSAEQAIESDGRGTDAQIEKERDIARHAIVGSLAAGYAGQAHPGTDHWLAAAHEAGARIKELEAQAAQSEPPGWADGVRVFSPGPMTQEKAAYFMRRFKHEEKLLGPNEQAAVDFVLSMLATTEQAEQGAGEVADALREIGGWDHRGDGVQEVWDELHGAGAYAALIRLATAQPVPVVPEALRKWHEAYGRYLHWNGEYNRKHALAEELNVPFPGPDLNTEFQAFTSAKNEAYRLQGPLHDAITAMLAATPTPPAQQPEAVPSEQSGWCVYVAGMVAGWLGMPVDDPKITTMGAIIERRLWALKRDTRPSQEASCRTCNGHGLIGGHMQDGSGHGETCPDCNSGQPVRAANGAFTKALEIRAAQGWKLTGEAVPVLYTDTINDQQVMRDDVWLCTTAALKPAQAAADARDAPAWLATRLWNAREEWTCPADIARMLNASSDPLSQAAADVLAERQRQINVEWWTPDHDDDHDDGALARAAACYALGKQSFRAFDGAPDVILWPWSNAAWKPTTPRRNLVKACALALAEIERMDRAAPATHQQGGSNA